jgi:predicted permease
MVPEDVRRDWIREWLAELDWRRRQGYPRPATTIRALGAWPHACWLRWDRWRWEMLWHDVTYAARTLIRKPGFAAIAVLSLALGIGANTAMFSVVHAVLLRPLPYPDPQQLVSIRTTAADRPGRGFESTPPDFVDWRRDTRGFVAMAAVVASATALTGDGPAEQVPSAFVTGGFFAVLGEPALHGRPLTTDDDPMGAPDVVVLGHALWQRRFGGDPSVVGRTIAVDGTPTRVVGVMPPHVRYPLNADLWLLQRFTADDLRTQRGAHYLDVLGRLAPGVSVQEGEAALVATAARLAEQHPRTNANRSVRVDPLRDVLVGDVRQALLVMLGAVGFVLLIVCVNVANLCLTRALGRQREFAVRTALGAGRARLVRALLVESALLAVAGGVGGVIIAAWAARFVASLDESTGIVLLDQTRLDPTVLLVAGGLAALTMVLAGTLPAWQASSRLDVSRGVREDSGTTTGTRHRRRLRGGLIVAETALAVVLLVGAGLLMRSFLALASVDLGFRPEQVQTFSLSLPEARYPTPVARATFVETLLARLAARPQVEAAGAIFGLPLTNFGYVISMSTLDGRRLDDEEQNRRSLQVRVVTPDYFRAMGIPVRLGRVFSDIDRPGAPAVVVVNQTAADRLWPGESPLGHEFTLGTRLGQGGAPVGGTVIGVVGDVHDGGPAAAVRPTMYVAHGHFPTSFLSMAVKSRTEAAALVEPLRETLAELDPALPMFRVRSMSQLADNAVARPRLLLTLLGVFAAAAVLLAAIGIYGVLAHGVSQRTREIGLRLALGAARADVLRMVVRQALVLALTGLIIGLAMAVAFGRALQSLLFGITPADVPTYLAVVVGLGIVAVVASIVPALRAARIDPITALRTE